MPDLFGQVSTEDTGVRSDFDFYETPAWMTRSLLAHHPAIRRSSVIECCSGRDAIARVLREEAECLVYTNDINPQHRGAMSHMDATKAEFWRRAPKFIDWVVTNPTFSDAFQILVRAHETAHRGVALLLRKTFLEPTAERGAWLAEHPPTRILGQPRHSFRGAGSDSVASDWFIWEKRPDRALAPIVIDHLAKSRTRPA